MPASRSSSVTGVASGSGSGSASSSVCSSSSPKEIGKISGVFSTSTCSVTAGASGSGTTSSFVLLWRAWNPIERAMIAARTTATAAVAFLLKNFFDALFFFAFSAVARAAVSEIVSGFSSAFSSAFSEAPSATATTTGSSLVSSDELSKAASSAFNLSLSSSNCFLYSSSWSNE